MFSDTVSVICTGRIVEGDVGGVYREGGGEGYTEREGERGIQRGGGRGRGGGGRGGEEVIALYYCVLLTFLIRNVQYDHFYRT